MSKNNLKFVPLSDLELLEKTIFYLDSLCSLLPSSRLQYHCMGAIASIYELVFGLKARNLKDYGNNKK